MELYSYLNDVKKNVTPPIAKFIGASLYNLDSTFSQNLQDVWALMESNFKHGGKFIEFGAADGMNGSNTYLLEKMYGWTGVVSEPLPQHTENLHKIRSCAITTDCVWTKSNKTLEFNVTPELDLSTISGFGNDDEHAEKRKLGTTIQVKTISLADLISSYFHTNEIDYMSVDTEGSEFQILQAYFTNPTSLRYKINTISVEHNFHTEKRTAIFNLMNQYGYELKFPEFSRWDDFYKLKG